MRAVVAYDGSGFHGFARNDPHPTVAGFLEEVLGRALHCDVRLTGAGRTDRGVHARGQVVSFDAPVGGWDERRLARSVHRLSGGAVVIRSMRAAPADFDARFSARWRRYRYHVRPGAAVEPWRRGHEWSVAEPLDVEGMSAGARHLLGEHDFAACCRRPTPAPGGEPASLVRRVLDAAWEENEDGLLRFEIRAGSFCHQMVRSLVGLLVDVGRGRLDPPEVAEVIAAGDRAGVRTLAPPHGLVLWDVGYDDGGKGSGGDGDPSGPHLPPKMGDR